MKVEVASGKRVLSLSLVCCLELTRRPECRISDYAYNLELNCLHNLCFRNEGISGEARLLPQTWRIGEGYDSTLYLCSRLRSHFNS